MITMNINTFTHMQVLQYMRTDVNVGGKAVLAVVLSDVGCLKYSLPLIRKAITAAQYGQTVITKGFLQPGEKSTVVKRGVKSGRHRCATIYLENIDEETCDQLKKRECCM